MRRVATLIVAIGLTVTGIGTSAALGHAGPARPAATARLTGLALRAGPGVTVPAKVVRFEGYVIDVPASWPVYRLDRDHARCVRYDQHAVYLGRPGSDQQCPAHLVGRVETISLAPGASGGPGIPASPQPPGPQWQAAASGLSLGQLQAGGVVLQDPQDHQFWGSFSHQGLTISATYGTDAGLVGQIIRTLRWSGAAPQAGPGQAGPGQAGPGQAGPGSAGGQPAPAGHPAAASRAHAAPAVLTRAARRNRPALPGAGSRCHFGRGIQHGFDVCATPSVATMRKWRQVFSAIAIYIGGPEAACGLGNLSASWVRTVTGMGWSLIPTYVGRQAPCTRFSVRIRKGHAHVEGMAAARDAIALAASLGIGRGAPIYDDMEFYNDRNGVCRRQVLSFLNSWTRELHRRGYVSGVYSSADAGVKNLGQSASVYQWRLAKPDSVWFGLWDGHANLRGMPYLLPSWWSRGHRIKQYMGSHRRRIGGVTLDIDSDMVRGAVYR